MIDKEKLKELIDETNRLREVEVNLYSAIGKERRKLVKAQGQINHLEAQLRETRDAVYKTAVAIVMFYKPEVEESNEETFRP